MLAHRNALLWFIIKLIPSRIYDKMIHSHKGGISIQYLSHDSHKALPLNKRMFVSVVKHIGIYHRGKNVILKCPRYLLPNIISW